MRISCDECIEKGIMYEVYLDGVKLDNCFMADEELGEAHCFKKSKDDKFFIDEETGKVAIEVLKGEIVLKQTKFNEKV